MTQITSCSCVRIMIKTSQWLLNIVIFIKLRHRPSLSPHNKHNLTPEKQEEKSKPTKVFIDAIHFNIHYLNTNQPMAYFWVQLRAVASYLARSVLYMWAISGTSGSSGFGSVSNEQIESSTCICQAKHNYKTLLLGIPLNISNDFHKKHDFINS